MNVWRKWGHSLIQEASIKRSFWCPMVLLCRHTSDLCCSCNGKPQKLRLIHSHDLPPQMCTTPSYSLLCDSGPSLIPYVSGHGMQEQHMPPSCPSGETPWEASYMLLTGVVELKPCCVQWQSWYCVLLLAFSPGLPLPPASWDHLPNKSPVPRS